jgi:hypothetical protein
MLRKAFTDTMKDREFIADAKKSNLSVDPMTAEELRRTLVRLFKVDSRLVEKLKDVLKR